MRRLAPLAAVALLAACGAAPPPPPAPPQKTVIDAQTQALQKAKAVQATVDQQQQDAARKIDDAGG